MTMRTLRAALMRLRGLLAGGRHDAAFREELETHRQLAIDEGIHAGLTPEAARRAAAVRLGSLDAATDAYRDRRGVPLLSDAAHDVRLALRTLRRQPAFAALACTTLALGIGANTAVFSVIDAVLLKPLPFVDSGHLVFATGKFPGGDTAGVSPADFRDYRSSTRSFEQFAAKAGFDSTITIAGGDAPELVHSIAVSWNFFEMLGVPPALGRAFVPADEDTDRPRVAILSHALWLRDFAGDSAIVGRTILLDGVSTEVVGVSPRDLPEISRADVWLPFPMRNRDATQRSAHFLYVLGRLKPAVTLESARADLDSVARRLAVTYPANDTGWSLNVRPLVDAIVGDVRPVLVLLFAAVGVLLVIGCANVANLLLARGAVRRTEMAVRASLGAGRGRLMRQLLTESIVVAVIGSAAGAILAVSGVAWLRRAAPVDLPRLAEIRVDAVALLFTLAISCLTGVVLGLLPALSVSRTDALREGGPLSGRVLRHRTGNALVVGQVALAVVLLVAGGMLLNSLWRLARIDPGFRADGVVTARLSLPNARYPEAWQRAGFIRDVETRLSQVTGVQATGTISELPLNQQYGDSPFTIEGRRYEPHVFDDADSREVSPGYLAAMGIPLAAGRWIEANDRAGATPVVVVNEAFASRFFPGSHALGQQLSLVDDPFKAREIVGVIGTVRHYELAEQPRPEMYIPLAQSNYAEMSLVIHTTGDVDALAGILAPLVRSVDPNQPIANVRTMSAVVSSSTAGTRFTALLVGAFATSALLLAGIGLHGLIAYTVVLRTREIGIRMALGASPSAMRRQVILHAWALVLAGGAIGAAGAGAGARLVSGALLGIGAIDPATFVAVSSLLILIALAAPLAPARRAMRVDPIVALRTD